MDVMESSGVRLGLPLIRMPWSSLAPESFARNPEIACDAVKLTQLRHLY